VDKAEFIEKAPLYYMLAIADSVANVGFAESRESIKKKYGQHFTESSDQVFDEAAKRLTRRDIITIDHDDLRDRVLGWQGLRGAAATKGAETTNAFN